MIRYEEFDTCGGAKIYKNLILYQAGTAPNWGVNGTYSGVVLFFPLSVIACGTRILPNEGSTNVSFQPWCSYSCGFRTLRYPRHRWANLHVHDERRCSAVQFR